MNNQLIVPETLYFATHVAIADNRIFDKEWYRIEDTLNREEFDEEVRNNVIKIVLDRPDKITLEQTIEALMEKPVEVRMLAMRLGLQIAYEDGNFGERESVIFDILRSKLRIDRRQYDSLCAEAESIVAGTHGDDSGNQIVIRA